LTWEHVKQAGSYRDAIAAFDAYASEHLMDKNAGPGAAPKFAFVTLTPWDLRVQMPREARDKSVVLPAYMQHPVLFGLRSEYQTFQSHHPETLAFSSSSLSSICAGLEVEEVRSSGKVTGGLPFHLQALAPSSPRRALEEALTLTRCLRSLSQKSRPSQANPSGDSDVLTRPLDARSDVRAFLGERSKVLHLSGLPHDTTQSELESWFTQYGGRPIAFWTLRTPEGGKPSGSGFVVFGSHEEVSSNISFNRDILQSPSFTCTVHVNARMRPVRHPLRTRPCHVTLPFELRHGILNPKRSSLHSTPNPRLHGRKTLWNAHLLFLQQTHRSHFCDHTFHTSLLRIPSHLTHHGTDVVQHR
jgi:hypothetical protein